MPGSQHGVWDAVTVKQLQKLEYDTIVASNGDEALQALVSRTRKFRMPHFNTYYGVEASVKVEFWKLLRTGKCALWVW